MRGRVFDPPLFPCVSYIRSAIGHFVYALILERKFMCEKS